MIAKIIGIYWRLFSRVLGWGYLKLVMIDSYGYVLFYGLPIFNKYEGSKIVLGNNLVLCSSSLHTALGVSKPIIIKTLTEKARLIIGNDVGMSGVTICVADQVTIDDGCLIGADVTIVDTDFHQIKTLERRYAKLEYASTAKVSIGKNVFIGAKSIVLKGVSIGDNSVIGAGSVVTKDIPANVIAAGNPCKIIKFIF